MKRYLLTLLVLSLLSLPVTSPAATDKPVAVSVAVILESREKLLVPSDEHRRESFSNVVLKVQGEALQGATAYANFRIDEAVDDSGTDLRMKRALQLKSASAMHLAHARESTSGHPPYIYISFVIGPSPRNANKIARLRGQVQVRTGGELKSIVLPKLKDLKKGFPADPTLVSEKLHLNWEDDSDPNNFLIVATGNMASLLSFDALDSDGSTLKHADQDHVLFGQSSLSILSLPRQPDNAMSLRINLRVSQETLTIPFDLKDIPYR